MCRHAYDAGGGKVKVERFLCPFVGCYFAAAVKGVSEGAVDDAREKVQAHRHEKHRSHSTLSSYLDGKTWEHDV